SRACSVSHWTSEFDGTFMLIGIIETGRPPEQISAAPGSYPDMFERLLRGVSGDIAFRTFAALDGDVPEDPAVCDGWLITGSKHGVYEKLDWIVRLEEFVRAAFKANVPMVGICFGHQVIASALGGTVIQSEKGWGVGHHDYDLVAPPAWMTPRPKTFSINAVHQDQVIEAPEGAEVIASSEFCENAVLAYGDTAFTIQPHPEFDDAFKRDLMEERLAGLVPADRMDAAYATLGQQMDNVIAAQWIVDFLSHALEKRGKDTAADATPVPA
ncbi:MAG: type 1 glutamine amidotransferase, partial [Hyphomicrobiaceae bacterium]